MPSTSVSRRMSALVPSVTFIPASPSPSPSPLLLPSCSPLSPRTLFPPLRPPSVSHHYRRLSVFPTAAPPPRTAAATRAPCAMAEKVATTTTPPWPALSTHVRPVDLVNGPIIASPTKQQEYTRLFGQPAADVRLIFYRDHALWCPYCHKVQLLLELKRVPYICKKVNMSCYGSKPREFLKKVPSGLLPVIELDGKIITESMDIMFIIEDTFQTPYRSTIPVDDSEMMQAFHRYVRLDRVYIGAWIGSLRGAFSAVGRGMEPVHHSLDAIEKSLGQFAGPFFFPGNEPSFVDINFSSMLERTNSSLKYWRNCDITEGRPNLQNWFRQWMQWEPASYLRSDDWTHIGALPPQIGPVKFLKQRAPVSINVETSRQRFVLNDGPERLVERNLAAAALCRNSDVVVKDAIRGAKAVENDHKYIDHALRIIAQVLLDPDLLEVLEQRARTEIPRTAWKTVGDGIRFERIRCCAPRDMPLLAMEQFSGAINWLLRTLEQDL